MTKKNKRNLVIALAMVAVLAVGMISAYFTSTDSAVNTFTVGKVIIDQQEPHWEEPTDIVPNQEIAKDPQIENTGDNGAYVFEVVRVPKATIITSATATGTKAAAGASTQLFQLNKTANSDGADVWTGTDTYHDEAWTLIATDPTGSDTTNYVTYVFAYGSSSACTVLAAGATTTVPVFESVTFANAIETQGLEDTSLTVKVDGFGIQKDFITNNDTGATSPAAVWAVLNAQNGAIANLN